VVGVALVVVDSKSCWVDRHRPFVRAYDLLEIGKP